MDPPLGVDSHDSDTVGDRSTHGPMVIVSPLKDRIVGPLI